MGQGRPPRPRTPLGERLERWLDDAAERDHTPAERRAFSARLVDPSIGDYPGEGETRPQRIVVAWRLVRELGRCSGLLHEDESLKDAWGPLERSPWDVPFARATRPGALPAPPGKQSHARRVLDVLGDELGAIPPGIPERWSVTPAVRDAYDQSNPTHDPPLHAWCRALELCAARLRVGETKDGRHGLRGLLDPASARELFPTREEVEDFEDVLVDATLEKLVTDGDRATTDWLREKYGLTPAEANGIVGVVDQRSVQMRGRTTEQWRDRILGYLDEIRSSALEACDIRTARWAVRDMASVSGVLSTDVDDLGRDMERAADELDAEDEARGPTGISPGSAGPQGSGDVGFKNATGT